MTHGTRKNKENWVWIVEIVVFKGRIWCGLNHQHSSSSYGSFHRKLFKKKKPENDENGDVVAGENAQNNELAVVETETTK